MKRKLLIAAGVFLALIVVAVIALSVLVRAYLKSDQLKAVIIPRAEEYTGRKVSIDRIDVSLFKGIVVKKLDVKEEGRDFVSVEEFVLAYDLLPLLRKELVISRVEIISPRINIRRLPDGSFNFSDILKKPGEKEAAPEKKEAGGLPVSLVTDRVLLRDARVEFVDEMKALPDVSAEADADFKVSLKEKISAEGYVTLKKLDAALGGIRTSTTGRLDIRRDLLEADIATTVDGKPIALKASVRDYATAPDATFALNAEEVDVDKLLALAGAGKHGKEKRPEGKMHEAPEATPGKPIEKTPMEVKASGTVDVKSAKYGEFKVSDLHLSADAAIKVGSISGKANIKEFRANVNGIGINASGTVDLIAEGAKAALKTSIDLPGVFKYKEYAAQGVKLDASPDVTYLSAEQKVKAHVPVRALTAASLSAKDAPITNLSYSGVADVAYGLKDGALAATVNMDDMKATAMGVELAAKGTVSYDGRTLGAALKELTARAAEYASGDYKIKGLALSAATDIKVDLNTKMPTGGFVDIKDFKANVNGVDAGLRGRASAAEKKLVADLTATVDKEEAKLSATALNYADAPDVTFDLYAKKLDLDRLMALTGGKEEKSGTPKEAPAAKPAPKTGEGKPLKVRAKGAVRVDRADYKGYTVEGFNAKLSYLDDALTADPVKMALKGGTSMVVDGSFAGNVSFKYPRGSADAASVMKRTMQGKGASKFKKVQIKDVKVAEAIAALTGVEELRTPTFTDSEMNYNIRDERVFLDGFMKSERIRFTTGGFVGLDKALGMEAVLTLDPLLSRRLIVTQFIKEKDGSSTLPLVIKGTTDKPKVNIDAEKVIKREVDKGIKKLFEKVIPQEKQPSEEPQPPAEEERKLRPEDIFKGIFKR